MSNGIHAIKGFDYQATVILDVILEHFDRYGVAEDDAGNRKPSPWTLAQVVATDVADPPGE
jgi:hypothetical protein